MASSYRQVAFASGEQLVTSGPPLHGHNGAQLLLVISPGTGSLCR